MTEADAMRGLINTVSMCGTVVIAKERKTKHRCCSGEQVRDGTAPECDSRSTRSMEHLHGYGTTLGPGGHRDRRAWIELDPSAVFYMDKIATGPEAADVIDITAPVAESVKRVAKDKLKPRSEVTCVPHRALLEVLIEFRGPCHRQPP